LEGVLEKMKGCIDDAIKLLHISDNIGASMCINEINDLGEVMLDLEPVPPDADRIAAAHQVEILDREGGR